MRRSRRLGPTLSLVAALAAGACLEQPPAPVVFHHRTPVSPPPLPGMTGPAAPLPRPAGGEVEVQAGDTVFALSRRYGVPVRALIDDNRLQPPFLLHVGQRLTLPQGRYHLVQPGETIYGISRQYGVDSFSLARANDLGPPYSLTPGQNLAVPGSTAAAPAGGPPAILSEPLAPVPTRDPQAAPRMDPSPAPRSADATPAPVPAARERIVEPKAPASAAPAPSPDRPASAQGREARRFAWPVQGRVISGFGSKQGGLHNDGINIAARRGEAVQAADDGVVAYAGNELKGFGNLLLIRHANGWVTAYAHADQILVKKGERVQRGQAVARVGQSGSVSEPQLHFEIRRGTQAVDPLAHLG